MSNIVFVGLGQMGAHLAAHIAAAGDTRGVVVHGYDIDAERTRQVTTGSSLEPLVTPGALVEAVGAASTVCLSLPGGDAVRSLLLDDLGPEALTDTTVIDFSSIAPEVAREICDRMTGAGCTYIDAPVTGGVIGAEAASLVVMVGAPRDALGADTWIVDAVASRVVYVGSVGLGSLLKTVSNMIGNVIALVSIEGIVMALKSGIEEDVLLDVLNHGPARTYFSEVRYPRYVATGTFDSGMKLSLVNKDLEIARAAAEDCEVDLVVSAAGMQLWKTALDEAGGSADTTRVVESVTRRIAGMEWQDVDRT